MILSIETSTPVCSVAIHQEGILLGSYELHTDKSHSEALTQMIESLLKTLKIEMSSLSAVALSAGPGSYTGLRIGTSTAKGICFGNNIPLISVDTLKSMALQVAQNFAGTSALLIPMIDARRMEAYTAYFTPELAEAEAVHAKIIDEESFQRELDNYNKLVLFGNGAGKCQSVLTDDRFLFLKGIVPHAKQIGELAWAKFQQQQFEDIAYYEPFYLKEFKATKPKKRFLV